MSKLNERETFIKLFYSRVPTEQRHRTLWGLVTAHGSYDCFTHGFTGRFLWSQCRSVTSVQLLLGAVPPPVQTLWTDLQQPGLDVQSFGQESFSRCISEHVN